MATEMAVGTVTGRPIPALGLTNPQALAPSGVSTQSAAVSNRTTVVRIVTTHPMNFEIGADPTATAGSHFMPPSSPEYFKISPGHKVAVFAAEGTAYISEGA